MSTTNKDEQTSQSAANDLPTKKQVTMDEEEFKAENRDDLLEDDENWFELRVEGKQPERRANHSSFIVSNKMYIFGGYDMREGPMASTWSFDLSNVGELQNSDLHADSMPSMTWQPIQANGVKKPGSLSDHTSVIYNKKMYLYGGSQGLSSNGTLYSFDPLTNLWDPVRCKPVGEFDPNKPPEVDEHTAVVWDDDMIIFGGFVDGERSNSIYKFNFKSGEWT